MDEQRERKCRICGKRLVARVIWECPDEVWSQVWGNQPLQIVAVTPDHIHVPERAASDAGDSGGPAAALT